MSSEKDYSVLPEVTVIQELAKIELEEHKPKKLRVCAYARVSTEKEEQEYSFENQRDYYMDYISKWSDWEFVGIYSDFGLSGKNKKRPQFIKMIDDCHAGKIDRIITKSISRFARNTIDCIQTVRDLRENGIGVYFEREGIDSLSPQSALVLSIMAIVYKGEPIDLKRHKKTLFGMFQGEEQLVEFQADASILDPIFDIFGDKVEITPDENGKLRFKAAVQLSPTFFGWCLSFGDKLQVVGPNEVVEKIREHINTLLKFY